MADYFSEMGWRELADGERPNYLSHISRIFREQGMFEELRALHGNGLSPPASKAAVEALESETISKSGINCPICLSEYSVGELVKKMPCKHFFHPHCILPWLAKTNSCPLCKFELPTDDEHYEEQRRRKKREKEREANVETLHNSMFS
ncbi:hypothetical protein ABEB36_006083 [Hypothenemus hampei]|uniref:E3 ubiquitin-protein ligase RNF181 n=1 Tax=Hypothenemus hampei TaxID=57062 RepID=A0ABD1F3J0_HYPHA